MPFSGAFAFGRIDVLFNNAGVALPKRHRSTSSRSSNGKCLDTNMTGVPLHTRGRGVDEAAGAARRTHHQQRFDFGVCAAPVQRSLYVRQAWRARDEPVAGAGRAEFRHRLQPDRHRQRGDRDGHSDGQRVPAGRTARWLEPLLDLRHVVDAVLFMASLPLQANIPNLTIMPTGMPFVEQG